MNDQTLEKLNKLFSLIKEDTLTPKEVEQFLVMVLEVVKKSKAEFESLSKENLAIISESVEYIKQLGNTLDTDLSKKSATLLKKIEDKLTLVDKKISAIKSIKVKDGKDGLDGRDGKDADEDFIVKKVLEQIPETEEIEGEDIVEKINKLPLEEDKKIDASHIKNLPKQTIYGGTSGVKEIIAGSNMAVDNSNPQYPVVSSTGGGGGGSPGGSDTQVQFNDGGSFGGDAGLTYDKTTGVLGVESIQSGNSLEIGAVGGVTVDADTIVLRGASSFGVSNNGGSNIAYFDTTSQTADRTLTTPDEDGIITLSVNNVTADTSGNISLDAYAIPYDGAEANVGDQLATLENGKASTQTTSIILDNNSAPSSATSGTAITQVYESILVPGGAYGNTFSIECFLRSRKVNTNSTYVAYFYINTTNNFATATAIGSSQTDLSSRLTSGLYREIRVASNTYYVYPTGAGNVTDISNQTATATTGTWNTANDMYIFRALKANNASDTVDGVGSRIVLHPGV